MSILPPSRPKIKEADLYKLINFNFHEKVFLVGIRGYYEKTMGDPTKNDRGIYDDAMIIAAPNYYRTFNGNTDPSKHQHGIGCIIPGTYYYKKGKHGISRPAPYVPYDAFRPATPDESLPGKRDGSDAIVKIIAPNIHRGGVNTTSSHACQTIPPSQWDEFQKKAYELMDEYDQKLIPYVLIEM